MASKKATYYEVLGVAPSVSREEIKLAYRQLVKTLHPDVSYLEKTDHQVGAETEQMVHINEAYATLIDSEKRAHYNSTVIHSRARSQVRMPAHMQDSLDEEKATERYLRQVFHPLTKCLKLVPHCISQAADGLDELRYFCQNYDYDHLAMADNLFKIAIEHSN